MNSESQYIYRLTGFPPAISPDRVRQMFADNLLLVKSIFISEIITTTYNECYVSTLDQQTYNKFQSPEIYALLAEIFQSSITVDNIGLGNLEEIGKYILVQNIPPISERLIRDKFTKYEGLQELIFLNELHAQSNQSSNILLRYDQAASGLTVYCDMNNSPIILGEMPLQISILSQSRFSTLSSSFFLDQPLDKSNSMSVTPIMTSGNNTPTQQVYMSQMQPMNPNVPPNMLLNASSMPFYPHDFKQRSNSFNSNNKPHVSLTDSEEVPIPHPINTVVHSQPASSISSPVYAMSKNFRQSSAHFIPQFENVILSNPSSRESSRQSSRQNSPHSLTANGVFHQQSLPNPPSNNVTPQIVSLPPQQQQQQQYQYHFDMPLPQQYYHTNQSNNGINPSPLTLSPMSSMMVRPPLIPHSQQQQQQQQQQQSNSQIASPIMQSPLMQSPVQINPSYFNGYNGNMMMNSGNGSTPLIMPSPYHSQYSSSNSSYMGDNSPYTDLTPSTPDMDYQYMYYEVQQPLQQYQIRPTIQLREIELPQGLSQGSCGVGYDPNREGPPGANLFIYNIPKTYCDIHLYHAFERFGTILSAKVFIDKPSGTTRGFGFVSYVSPECAQMAIREMNGKTLDGRKIKVEIKRRDVHEDRHSNMMSGNMNLPLSNQQILNNMNNNS